MKITTDGRMSNHNAYILVYEKTDDISKATASLAEENEGYVKISI